MTAWQPVLIPAMWAAWLAYWWIASRDVKQTARREPIASRLAHIVPLVFAGWLLGRSATGTPLVPWLYERFVPYSEGVYLAGALATLAGLLFTVWARLTLGRNWSGIVTVKKEHQLITTGPYRWVRHPIYTGLLLAFLGSALARGEWRGLVATVIVLAAFWRKLRLEEQWMREMFPDAYEAYAKRVAPLVPFLH